MKTLGIALLCVVTISASCFPQRYQQVTMVNQNGDYSYGTMYNPNYFQEQNERDTGPGLLQVLLEHSQKSDELEWKKKVAAEQAANRKAAAKRASEAAKQTAEMKAKCQQLAQGIFEMYDKVKGLNAWDSQAISFRKKVSDLIAEDPYQACLILIELDEKLGSALAEAEQRRQEEEYRKAWEASRPKGLGERLRNAYNALFPSKSQSAQTSQLPPGQASLAEDNFGFVPDPVQNAQQKTSTFDPSKPYEVIYDPSK